MKMIKGYHGEWNMGSPGDWEYQRIAQLLGKAAWNLIQRTVEVGVDLDFDHPQINAVPGFARMLGGVRPALEAGFTRLPPGWEVGMIAGSRGMGLGLLVGGTSGAGDGTVAVSETRADGLQDHLVLPVTHTGLLFSRSVARQVTSFLRSGSFSGTP